MNIPTNITNITRIDGNAIALRIRTIEFTNPVHAERIVIGGLHFLRLIHLETLCRAELLLDEVGAGETVGVERWLLDGEGGEALDGGLRLDDVGVGVWVHWWLRVVHCW